VATRRKIEEGPPGKPTWIVPCQSTGWILPLSSEVLRSGWSLDEMSICQKKFHGKKRVQLA
jgi:hypothetical protein